jgi:glucosamine--fructose-6-phosphate aminotransferase (isomerizing)
MCGIFGISITKESSLSKNQYKKILRDLFLLSESRGKEAAGFSFNNGNQIRVFKTPFPASDLVVSSLYENELNHLLSADAQHFSTIGHSRLVTDGYEHDNANNQPVIKKGIVAVHNGIIVNSGKLWQKFSDEKKDTELDSELIPVLIRRFQADSTLVTALNKFYQEIYGLVSSAMMFDDLNNMLLATNNGSLYYCASTDKKSFVFASERYIMRQLIIQNNLQLIFAEENIKQLHAGSCCLLNLTSSETELHTFNKETESEFNLLEKKEKGVGIIEVEGTITSKKIHVNKSIGRRNVSVPKAFLDLSWDRTRKIETLERCTKCILPYTFPFIKFDEKGVCNYCNHYRPLKFKGIEQFKELCDRYRSKDGSPDCLLPFSGGRDSSYAIHYVKEELKMNPIAFSYDWGMITDLARRNQARMCGKLGIEHILISADIRTKRSNIRKNVLAWLKRPNLGTIPLFMAGDKQYFYYSNLLMEQNNLKISILGENMLEATKFKSGFCGIEPNFEAEKTHSLSTPDKIKMALYYGKEYLLNPAYLNSSMLDTLDAFKSYYIMQHQTVNIFDYLEWHEEEIEKAIIDNYDWETDPETITTWRIGDGTAAFYNYIYYFVAGFTENDTFRSNQIREGLMTRDKALQRTHEENNPRWESLKWYCDTIDINFEKAIDTINNIPTLYSHA